MIQGSFKLDDKLVSGTPVACGERPTARLEEFGVRALSDTELLALILQAGLADRQALDLASRLIAEGGTLEGLLRWQAEEYRRWKGIGVTKAKQLVAIGEIARRMIRGNGPKLPLLKNAEAIAEYLQKEVRGLTVEKFWVLCLNRKFRLIKLVEVSSGIATSTLAHPREIFREAIRYGAIAIACAHNHPSGDPSASMGDIQITRVIRDASRTVDIELVDHVIVGRRDCDPTGKGFYSFRESGAI